MIPWLVALIVAVLVALFVVAAFSPRQLAARDQVALLLMGATALTAILVGRILIDWSQVPLFVWYLIIVAFAAGIAGAVLRWRRLPWLEDPAKRTRRSWGAAVSLVLLAAVAALVAF